MLKLMFICFFSMFANSPLCAQGLSLEAKVKACQINNYGASLTIGVAPLKPGCSVLETGFQKLDFKGYPFTFIHSPKFLGGRADFGITLNPYRTFDGRKAGLDERADVIGRVLLGEKKVRGTNFAFMAGPRANLRLRGVDPHLFGGIFGASAVSGKNAFTLNSQALKGRQRNYSTNNSLDFSREIGRGITGFTGVALSHYRGKPGQFGYEAGFVYGIPRANSQFEFAFQRLDVLGNPYTSLQFRYAVAVK